MAKKILAEKFSINSIDLAKDGSDKLLFNSLVQADSGDVTTLNVRISTEEKERSTQYLSLNTKISNEEILRADKVSSLDSRVLTEENLRSTKVDSLDTRIDSENATTKIMLGNAVGSGQSSLTVDISGEGYANGEDPVVMAMLRSTTSTDPILACMVNGVADHESVTIAFSDDTPSGDYLVDLILTR